MYVYIYVCIYIYLSPLLHAPFIKKYSHSCRVQSEAPVSWSINSPSVGVTRKAMHGSVVCLSKLSGCRSLDASCLERIEGRDYTISAFKQLVFCALAHQPLPLLFQDGHNMLGL